MILKDLTLDQKLGQVLCFGYNEDYASESLKEFIREKHIGNIILFARNFKDCAGLRRMIDELQDEALKTDGLPLLIGIDQEGGIVTRLYKEATFFPGAMATAAAGECENAYLIGQAIGRELLALGINFNFAPILDINTNPENPIISTRSYGDTPESATAYASAFTRGLQESIIATGKHFPGHGDTQQDSHITLPVVPHSKERLEEEELYPFKALIKEGIKALMTAHIVFPAYDPTGLPATLSEPVLTGLLRGKLGFDGIIITDCMEMKAVADFYGTPEAVVMALNAGADIILVCHTKDVQIESIRMLKEAVLADSALMAKLDKAVERVLRFKSELKETPDEGEMKKVIASAAHTELASRVSRASLTLYKGKCPVYKKDDKFAAVFFDTKALTGVENDEVKNVMGDAVKDYYKNAEVIYLPPNTGKEDTDRVLGLLANHAEAVVFTYNASLFPGQAEAVKRILEAKPEAYVIAARSPYDIRDLGSVNNYIMAYELTPPAAESVLAMLKGELIPAGKSPVDIMKGL
ncbi:MAG: beta-N-acetylhexosaminidase [Defluviitaleaceae bacterium]|nr:beta-N-acetylhexosaminidase [Defluviitaleaceae bacterium]MCL2837011.1 beta-N-acetylhexosaminidase [Defluviitaleaceae bacterium]